MKYAQVLIVVALGAAAVGGARLFSTAHSPAPQVRGESDSADEIRKELQALHEQVGQTRSLAMEAARRAAQPPEAQPAELATSAAVTEQSERPPPTEAEIRQRLEDEFTIDEVDRGWARAAVEEVRSQLSRQPTPGSEVLSIDCKSSMCRVETVHQDRDAFRDFFRATLVGPNHTWKGQTMAMLKGEDASGQLLATAYWLRAGKEFNLNDGPNALN